MKKIGLVLVILVLCSLASILVLGEIILLSGSNENTRINSVEYLANSTAYSSVHFGQNLVLRANCTDFENDRVAYVNFTLLSPDGYGYINNSNGTLFNDFWNSSVFQINETGTWRYMVQSADNDTLNTTPTNSSGTFEVTDDLDWTPNVIEATTNISVDKIYNIEFWTDSRESLNFTLSHDIDGNFTVTLNVSHLMINSSRGTSYLNINISPNSSTAYGNHSYNLSVNRIEVVDRTWNISIDIEITSNFGDIEFTSPSDYTFVACPGSLEHTDDVINNGNYGMTNCHSYLYDTNGTEISTSTNFNLAGGAAGKARVTYPYTEGEVITHLGVYCTASGSGSLDYTSNDPKITFTEGSGCGGGGAGGGAAAARPAVEAAEKVALPPEPRYCGDGTCDDDLGETPWSCSKDCLTPAILDFKKIFCVPLFKCGNWEKAWFINLIVLVIISYVLYFMFIRKVRRVKRL